MNTITAENNQSLLDICIQVNGSLDNLVALASLNGLAVDSTVETQTVVQYDMKASVPQVAKTFQLNDTRVVTGNATVEPLVVVSGETSGGRKLTFPVQQPLPNQYQPVYGQNIIDVCLQLTGSLDNLVAIAAANQTRVSAYPSEGDYLVFEPSTQAISPVAESFRLNGIYVTTLDTPTGLNIIQTEFENSEYEWQEYA